ncbi:MAG: hypothetical protein IT204_16540 [Fimbriimonadaceae bacterium]|nr:hypothetical protein [Fimbriimonadaceae bacterium]
MGHSVRSRRFAWAGLLAGALLLAGRATRPAPRPGAAPRLLPLGRVPADLLADLASDLTAVVAPAQPLPLELHEPRRQLWRAAGLLDAVPPGTVSQPALAIADVDAALPGRTCVFGLAEASQQRAIVFLSRLRNPRDRAALRQRARREALHELAHLAGGQHCPNRRCLLFPAVTPADVDRRGERFCRRCRASTAGRFSQLLGPLPELAVRDLPGQREGAEGVR